MSSIYNLQMNVQDVPFSPRNPKVASTLPFSSSRFLVNTREESTDFGPYKKCSLANLVDPNQPTLNNPRVFHLIKTHNNKIMINDEAIDLLNSYSNNNLAFISVYGKAQAGKSFWCDRTLDLAQIRGEARYISNTVIEPGIRFSCIPFTKGNIKIFLLDCTGFNKEELTREEEMRLDFMMSLSSAVIVLPEPEDNSSEIMKIANKHFTESQKRLRYLGSPANKTSNYWPRSCYCLYRSSEPIKKEMETIGELFKQYSFSIVYDAKSQTFTGEETVLRSASFLDTKIINDQYVRHVSWVTKDIYQKIKGKSLCNLKITDRTAPVIVQTLVDSINAKQKLDFDVIMDESTKKLYQNCLMSSQKFYLQSLKQGFKDVDKEKPLSYDEMFNILGKTRDQTYLFFDRESAEIDPNSQYALESEKLLDKILDNQQNFILESNRKNTQKILTQILPSIGDYNITNSEDFRMYLKDLKNANRNYDHQRSAAVNERLKVASHSSREEIFPISAQSEKIRQLEKKLEQKNNEYLELQKSKRDHEVQNSILNEDYTFMKAHSKRLQELSSILLTRNAAEKSLEKNLVGNSNPEFAKQSRVKYLTVARDGLSEQLHEIEKEKKSFEQWHNNKEQELSKQVLISVLMNDLDNCEKQAASMRSQIAQSQLHNARISGVRETEKRKVTQGSIKKLRMIP